MVQRRGLSSVVHDLVGITSALELRLEVIESVLPPADGAALRSVVHQLRAMSRTVRLLQGPDGPGVLSPSRELPLDEWWSLVESLTQGAMPRGVLLRAQCTNAKIPFAMAAAITQLWLLACEELASRMRVDTTVGVLEVRAHGAADGVDDGVDDDVNGGITLHATYLGARLKRRAFRATSRWERQARRVGESLRAELSWWRLVDDVATWHCFVPLR